MSIFLVCDFYQEFEIQVYQQTSPSCLKFTTSLYFMGVYADVADCSEEQDFLCQHLDTVGEPFKTTVLYMLSGIFLGHIQPDVTVMWTVSSLRS